MPTGYTAPVVDGEITELKEFVWRCARAFGALVYLRDSPLTNERPESVTGGHDSEKYHVENLDKDQTRLVWWTNASDEEVQAKMDEYNAEAVEENAKYLAKHNAELERLNAMQAKVEAWEPPTEDHKGLKRFMLEQLDISKPKGSAYQQPIYQDPAAFRAQKIESAERGVEYHTRQLAKERENNSGRGEWVEQLAKSLENT